MTIFENPIHETKTFIGDIFIPEINNMSVIPFTIEKIINRCSDSNNESIIYRIHLHKGFRGKIRRIIHEKIWKEYKKQNINL